MQHDIKLEKSLKSTSALTKTEIDRPASQGDVSAKLSTLSAAQNKSVNTQQSSIKEMDEYLGYSSIPKMIRGSNLLNLTPGAA